MHFLLPSDNEAMALYKCHHSIHCFTKLLTKTSPLLNYLKGNTSTFGSAKQELPSDIGEYLSSFYDAAVVVAVILFLFYN